MSWWMPPGGGEGLLSCSILTKDAAPSVAAVHDRMPVSLPSEVHTAWLDPAMQDAARVIAIVKDCAMTDFEHYPVSTRVNSTRNEDEKLVEAVGE